MSEAAAPSRWNAWIHPAPWVAFHDVLVVSRTAELEQRLDAVQRRESDE